MTQATSFEESLNILEAWLKACNECWPTSAGKYRLCDARSYSIWQVNMIYECEVTHCYRKDLPSSQKLHLRSSRSLAFLANAA